MAEEVKLEVRKSRIEGAGLGLFAASAHEEGARIGRVTGRLVSEGGLFVWESMSAAVEVAQRAGGDRLIVLRAAGEGWNVVDTRRADWPFEYANSTLNSGVEPNLHVTTRGWVEVMGAEGVAVGDELLWEYEYVGDRCMN